MDNAYTEQTSIPNQSRGREKSKEIDIYRNYLFACLLLVEFDEKFI